MMQWDDAPHDDMRDAEAFAKRWADLMNKAKAKGPLADSVKAEIERVREQEWQQHVTRSVLGIIYDVLGHKTYLVEEPTDRVNSGLLRRNWVDADGRDF